MLIIDNIMTKQPTNKNLIKTFGVELEFMWPTFAPGADDQVSISTEVYSPSHEVSWLPTFRGTAEPGRDDVMTQDLWEPALRLEYAMMPRHAPLGPINDRSSFNLWSPSEEFVRPLVSLAWQAACFYRRYRRCGSSSDFIDAKMFYLQKLNILLSHLGLWAQAAVGELTRQEDDDDGDQDQVLRVSLYARSVGLTSSYEINAFLMAVVRTFIDGAPFFQELSFLRGFQLKYDGSLHGQGMEIVSPILSCESKPALEESLDRVAKVANWLQETIGAHVDARCGLHVHFGVQPFLKHLKNNIRYDAAKSTALENSYFAFLARTYAKMEPTHFNKFVKANRLQGNTFCRSMQDWTISKAADTRYYNLNTVRAYQAHGTVEIRQLHGTLDPKVISAWVRLTHTFVENTSRAFMARVLSSSPDQAS